jgi:hypothetical protein
MAYIGGITLSHERYEDKYVNNALRRGRLPKDFKIAILNKTH